jgi:uncharacterized protein YjgD (DUF1641 family)
MDNQEHIENLLVEFAGQRDEIKEMLGELEILKKNIDSLFPETMDKRYKMFFDEKVKAATSFFNVLLDMRKELIKSLKDEIEIRRKIEHKDKMFDLDGLLDVRQMARTVETFKDKTEKLKKKRSTKGEVIKDGIEIPGVNSPVR